MCDSKSSQEICCFFCFLGYLLLIAEVDVIAEVDDESARIGVTRACDPSLERSAGSGC